MDISIGMLVSGKEMRQKYKAIIDYSLGNELVSTECIFFSSLNEMYDKMIYGSLRTDILIIQADKKCFDFAEKLRLADRNCLILYPAKDMGLVLDAFDSMPMAYIVPEDGGRNMLIGSVLKAAKYIKQTRGEIKFETKSRLLHYSLYEIDYFESQYRIVHIVKRNRQTEAITAKLDNVQAMLPANFYRCHQSFLVNMDNIDYVDKTESEIHFASGQVVPSSKKLFTDFLNAYKEYKDGEKINARL